MVFSSPLDKHMDCLIVSEFIERVEFPAQNLFRKFFMNKRVASSANFNPPLVHVRFFKMFFKPFVALAGLWNEMMEGNELIASAEGTYLTHPCRTCMNHTRLSLTITSYSSLAMSRGCSSGLISIENGNRATGYKFIEPKLFEWRVLLRFVPA